MRFRVFKLILYVQCLFGGGFLFGWVLLVGFFSFLPEFFLVSLLSTFFAC